MLFAKYNPNVCALCGETSNLTGEHKIKASAVKTVFGTESMVISTFGDPITQYRHAQGAKSKAFHFTSRLCADCNGSRTQGPDREFDNFLSSALDLYNHGKDPVFVFDAPDYEIGSESYLNIFRYFAKLLCCHLAEVGAPRPIHISNFAIGRSSANCIWLSVDKDPTFHDIASEFENIPYAAHGGLIVYGDKNTGAPNGFHSSITLGPLRFVFHSRLNWFQRIAVKFYHRQFYDWCSERAKEANESPISERDKNRLGL